MNKSGGQNELEMIENALEKYTRHDECLYACLHDAMAYSLLAGGKRLRPLLLLEFCKICGGELEKALPFACAVEMIHTYSLIHDDLPCMDDDDLRRGVPANHVVFGEDIALLAGDALLSLAFEVILSDENVKNLGAQKVARAAGVLAKACGVNGMIAGQVIDLTHEGKAVDVATLEQMHKKKTGALITAAATIGCIVAGASEEKIALAREFAENLGLAFQIVDDILDVTADENSLGKPVGSDAANDKSTYVSLLGLERANSLAKELTDKAVAALEGFGADVRALRELAVSLSKRQR